MTNSMRDKIADKLLEIAIDAPQSISGHELALTQADVIIAALPDMVQPLEFDDSGVARTPHGLYAIEMGISDKFIPVVYQCLATNQRTVVGESVGEWGTAGAKAAANKHHVEQLMKGLGL